MQSISEHKMEKSRHSDTALYLAISWGVVFGLCVGSAFSDSGAMVLLIPVSIIWMATLTFAALRWSRFPERFAIRDLLWLTVVVALAVGFAMERWSRHSERIDYERRLDASSRMSQELQADSAYLRRMLKDQSPSSKLPHSSP